MIGDVVIEGRENIIQLFEQRHRGIREIKNPKLVLHQGREVFAEIDMDVYHSFNITEKVSFVRRGEKFVFGSCSPRHNINDEILCIISTQ